MGKKMIFYFIILFSVVLFIYHNYNSLNKAENNYNQQKDELAIENYKKIKLNLLMDNNDKFEYGMSMIKNNNIKEAIRIFEEIEKSIDANDELHNNIIDNLGICYNKINESNKSISYFEKRSISNNVILEEHISYHYFSALNDIGQYEKMIDVAQEYLIKFPDEKKFKICILDWMFTTYISLEEFDNAADINKKLIYMEPNNTYHHLGTAYLLNYTEGYNSYREYLKKLQNKFPNDSDIKRLLGNEK